MRFNMLQLLKNLRSRSQGKEFSDADILNWANKKVKITGRTSHMDSFKFSSIFHCHGCNSSSIVADPESPALCSRLQYMMLAARIAKLQDDNKALDLFTKSKEAALLEVERSVQVVLAKASMVVVLETFSEVFLVFLDIARSSSLSL
ncbi:hypothetical protein RHGRI_009771 [Rhododendron griersonianum]|uniref:Uncharacterized protein n=1 Tax=Rhododendron griersonianum TaxID=479676 RepID=A0AAV6KFZ3_9ERIC|nr:hypothetical protein RHGRI_009771 [Rhododendron griersonianum]